MDLVQQLLVVFHVLKHLNNHHRVVVLDNTESNLVVGDVAGNNSNVVDVVTTGFGNR